MEATSNVITTLFLVLGPFVVLVLALRENGLTCRESIQAQVAASVRQSADLMKILEKVVMLKGLQPHHANPAEYTPGGMSWGSYGEMKKAQTEEQGKDIGSEEKVSQDEWLQDLVEHQRMLDQEQLYARAAYKSRQQPLEPPVHPMATAVPSTLSPQPADADDEMIVAR